ncbi:hypothetical protein [Pedobacter heparinus]|uniref:hypothetical protein n=1 Tax=Pedobacter heparinus TaxID=984 RepID=UPI00292ECAAF|nr:hypothetical protein [Pedobacter heparinus]
MPIIFTELSNFLFNNSLRISLPHQNQLVAVPPWGITGTIIIWLALQSFLSLNGLYASFPESIPPKIIVFGVVPAIISIILIFTTKKKGILNFPFSWLPSFIVPLVLFAHLASIRKLMNL